VGDSVKIKEVNIISITFIANKKDFFVTTKTKSQ
jgi:hypothetical protein